MTHIRVSPNVGGGLTASAAMKDALGMSTDLFSNTATAQYTNGGVSGCSNHVSLKRAPKHTKLASSIATNTRVDTMTSTSTGNGCNKPGDKNKQKLNPYAKSLSSNINVSKKSKKSPKACTDFLSQALGTPKRKGIHLGQKEKKEASHTQKRKRPRIVHAEGFDGDVEIPKANALFKRVACPSVRTQHLAMTPSPRDENEVLQKQKELASIILQQKHKKSNQNSSSTKKVIASNRHDPNNQVTTIMYTLCWPSGSSHIQLCFLLHCV